MLQRTNSSSDWRLHPHPEKKTTRRNAPVVLRPGWPPRHGLAEAPSGVPWIEDACAIQAALDQAVAPGAILVIGVGERGLRISVADLIQGLESHRIRARDRFDHPTTGHGAPDLHRLLERARDWIEVTAENLGGLEGNVRIEQRPLSVALDLLEQLRQSLAFGGVAANSAAVEGGAK